MLLFVLGDDLSPAEQLYALEVGISSFIDKLCDRTEIIA